LESFPTFARFEELEPIVHAAATHLTGLDDFGSPDYLEALRVLLKAYDEEATFSEAGRLGTVGTLINCLIGRLCSEEGWKQHPECLQHAIEQPIVILGLPRTGTTVLHKLLACDPANQALEYWLGCYPQPRPPRQTWANHEHYRRAAEQLDAIYKAKPEVKKIHYMKADEADECRLLLMQDFANVTLQSNATVPSYEQWLYKADMTMAYVRYRDNLKLIGANTPEKHWVLKDPSHMWAMDILLDTFPDVCVVQTHRDACKSIPSVCSLVYEMRCLSEPKVSPALIGEQQAAQWHKVMSQTLEVRRRRGEDNFYDVRFDDFVSDPLNVVRGLYAHLGREFTPDAEKAMARFLAENPQGKHGAHAYRVEQFGLSEAGLAEQFEDYNKAFGFTA